MSDDEVTARDGRTMNPKSLDNLKPLKPGESMMDRIPESERNQKIRKISLNKPFLELGVNPFHMWAALLSNNPDEMRKAGIPVIEKTKLDKSGNEVRIGWEVDGPLNINQLLDLLKQVTPYLAEKKGSAKAPSSPRKSLPSPDESDGATATIDMEDF